MFRPFSIQNGELLRFFLEVSLPQTVPGLDKTSQVAVARVGTFSRHGSDVAEATLAAEPLVERGHYDVGPHFQKLAESLPVIGAPPVPTEKDDAQAGVVKPNLLNVVHHLVVDSVLEPMPTQVGHQLSILVPRFLNNDDGDSHVHLRIYL